MKRVVESTRERLVVEVLVSWVATHGVHWPASWEPITMFPFGPDNDEMLNECLVVDEEDQDESVLAQDDKVNKLIAKPPAVGERFVFNLVAGGCSAGVVYAVSDDSVTVRIAAGPEPVKVPRANIVSAAPGRALAVSKGKYVRALLHSGCEGKEARRSWVYGTIVGVLTGGEIASVRFERERAPTAMCVYDLQDAETREWLA